MKVFNELKTRGLGDVRIAVTDGLQGIPDAVGATFPVTTLCADVHRVHLVRNRLEYASPKDRKRRAAARKRTALDERRDALRPYLSCMSLLTDATPWTARASARACSMFFSDRTNPLN